MTSRVRSANLVALDDVDVSGDGDGDGGRALESAERSVAHLLDGRVVLGDGGYRGITSISGPTRDQSGRIVHDQHYRAHRRIRARIEQLIARLKDWLLLRQCRRRGDAINRSFHIITGLWNLKIRTQLRVGS